MPSYEAIAGKSRNSFLLKDYFSLDRVLVRFHLRFCLSSLQFNFHMLRFYFFAKHILAKVTDKISNWLIGLMTPSKNFMFFKNTAEGTSIISACP